MAKKLNIITLLALLTIITPIPAGALSCAETHPRIATIESIDINQDNSFKLQLKWAYSFPEEKIATSPTIALESHLGVVQEYLADEQDSLTDLEEQEASWNYNEIDIVSSFASRLDISAGDIILTAPPIHVCSESFLGIFTDEGILKQAIIRGDFNNYSLNSEVLSLEPGKAIECKGYSCSVKADFQIAEEKYSLVPSQELDIEQSIFSKIFLLSSTAPEKGTDASAIFPWGGGRKVEYLVNFNPFELGSEANEENAEESPEQDGNTELDQELETEESPEEENPEAPNEVEKRPNIFIRFFSWIASLWK